MVYLSQLQNNSNAFTIKRKKEYIQYNFGHFIDKKLKNNNCSVLEIGAGLGDFIEYCRDRNVSQIDLVDNDKSVVEHIKKQNSVSNIHLADSMSGIEKKLSQYDIIMMTQVLEHVPKKEHIFLLKTLYDHLKEKGVIIITVPNIGNPLAIFERYYDYTHETAFTENSLLQLVDLTELKNARISLQPFRIPPYNAINIIRIFFQFFLHRFFQLLYILNGGVFPRVLTSNIILIIEKS